MADTPDGTRQISDSRVLAALTHPLRRRLLDLLKVDGPATVGQLAERTGQAVGNISHHVKVLAGSGLVEEVPELARDRRERWWRLAAAELSWARADFDHDPVAEAVADAAGSLLLERQAGLVRDWAARRHGYDPQWQEGCSVSTETWLRLTPEEARELAGDLVAVLQKWADRPVPEDGREREPVFAFAHSVPARP
ncbi:winged helix-turn-helix domain-containing protein [Kitasatospora aureofaciens]|uniref:winged helix-turn-helix domain-containing protein n=1 Tax=Kitasatospora aureofaciens TaxID=1894 RepID=UPI001C442592|nr:winged helix-turn-helix domain-containing protein [Kitasatospora aureofaciens]MBV6698130.1 winged helix-turn-helix domain-containing protein [Kitasatospora aureofaciens]